MKDAAGNDAKELTPFERRWRASIESGELTRRYRELSYRQNLPLRDKIKLSEERIHEWFEAFDGKVSVSFSGGKDSCALLHLVRRLYPETPAVFCNTGLEYPEILNLIRQTPNTETVRPKKPFHHVIRDCGWPIISKKVALGLSVLKNPTDGNQNIYRLYDIGINRFGQSVSGFRVPVRWRFLINSPFKISDKCCSVMKKEPMRRYERLTGYVQFVGTMASDSKQRQKTYLQFGCNSFDSKTPRSAPLSFWTTQDVIQYIAMKEVPYAKVYGDIRRNASGELYFSGVQSTGCVFCVFGLHMEQAPNRFQQMAETHPKLFDYCMNRLGLADVLDWTREHCPNRKIAAKFRYEPTKIYRQMELFG